MCQNRTTSSDTCDNLIKLDTKIVITVFTAIEVSEAPRDFSAVFALDVKFVNTDVCLLISLTVFFTVSNVVLNIVLYLGLWTSHYIKIVI